LPGCTVNRDACLQFKKLCDRWRKSYPKIDKDLDAAFASISENILANNGWRIQAGDGVEVYKYRQNSSDIRRGQSYGWRIDALYDKNSGTMYPIIVYPKTEWEDADTATVKAGIREILTFLGHCIVTGCDGMMTATDPAEYADVAGEQHVKTVCLKCRAVHWKTVTV
jgi:hypothetical protein